MLSQLRSNLLSQLSTHCVDNYIYLIYTISQFPPYCGENYAFSFSPVWRIFPSVVFNFNCRQFNLTLIFFLSITLVKSDIVFSNALRSGIFCFGILFIPPFVFHTHHISILFPLLAYSVQHRQ